MNEGQILIDNMPIQDITLASLRAQISIVLQETFIFQEPSRRIFGLENRMLPMMK